MNILFLGSVPDKLTTGGHVYHKQIVKALEEAGHKVAILSLRNFPTIFSNALLSFMYPAMKLIMWHPSRIVLVSDRIPRYLPFMFFARALNVPIVLMVHHITESLYGGRIKASVKYYCIKVGIALSRRIIVNSNDTGLSVIEAGGDLIRARISVVYPGIEIDLQKYKEKKFKKGNTLKLLAVGAVMKRKGYDYLVRALTIIKNIDFKCTIVGNIDDEKFHRELMQMVKDADMEEKIIFTGFVSRRKLADLFQEADIFLLASLHEGYGIVLCEAMCHGMPIIATDAGAVREVIGNSGAAILVRPRDVGAIAREIQELAGNPARMEALSREGIQKCREFRKWRQVRRDISRIIV
jgi:glycosyltransferase involved in cell wall biosynthesis